MGFFEGVKKMMRDAQWTICLDYLGGHPDLTKSGFATIKRQEDHLDLFCGGSETSIPLSAIRSVKLVPANSRSLGKAAGGSIAGGMIGGPVGFIIGGAVGGRKKKESVIAMTVQYGAAELEILFGAIAEGTYPKLVHLLKTNPQVVDIGCS